MSYITILNKKNDKWIYRIIQSEGEGEDIADIFQSLYRSCFVSVSYDKDACKFIVHMLASIYLEFPVEFYEEIKDKVDRKIFEEAILKSVCAEDLRSLLEFLKAKPQHKYLKKDREITYDAEI